MGAGGGQRNRVARHDLPGHPLRVHPLRAERVAHEGDEEAASGARLPVGALRRGGGDRPPLPGRRVHLRAPPGGLIRTGVLQHRRILCRQRHLDG